MEEKDASGEVVNTTYRFKLLDGLKFSDGKPVTADDVIFSIKVLCDPTYNGLSAVGSLPIIGLEEYKYDRPDYEEAVDSIKIQAEELPDSYVKEYIMEMAKADVAAYSRKISPPILGSIWILL